MGVKSTPRTSDIPYVVQRHVLLGDGSRAVPLHALLTSRLPRGALLLLALAAILGALTGSSRAAAGPLTVTPVTWDVLGLDSNNVNTGPAAFPVGVRVCNTGSDPATNVVGTWSWKTAQGSFTAPAEGATAEVGTMTAAECRQVFFEVQLNRNPSSRKKSRDYQITVTGDGGLSASGPRRTLYVQPLVSQSRNSTKKLAGPGGCNLTYTVCDPAPLNLVVGRTYTYKLYAETSTAYKQIETFASLNASFLQVVSTSATYSNPSGGSSPSWYGDACGWDPATRTCVGPVNIAGGKAGGRVVVTIVAKAVATGTLAAASVKPVIYDFSGASYHYNADHDSFALTSGAITVRYELETTVTGNGKVTSSPNGTTSTGVSSGIDCGGAGTTCAVGYGSGTTVTLTATGNGLDLFTGWSGGSCSGLVPICVVTMDQSRSVTASFTGESSYPLTVSKVGNGTVTASSGALDCGATCVANYASGTVVTLTASAATGWAFDGWSGAGCSGTGTCAVAMSDPRTVTATFSEQTFELTATVTGNGIVSSDPGIVYCGNGNTSCSDVYGAGTVVTLTATPGSGQSLTGWSGACSGSASTCVVTMSEARSVTASFTGTTTYTLDVATGGSGTGTVTSSPAGINCGSTCSASYADGTSVTLTASAGSGSSLTGWSGDCSGTATTCTVTMSQARDVTASFGTPQTLTVTKSGAGSGTVTSSPAGVDCGATCSASFAEGTSVTLTATPAGGSAFTGWSGDCSGTASCTVTMTQARAVTATFVPAYTLTITRSGSGMGTVTSSPAGVDCGTMCSAEYVSSTSVTLSAAASTGSRFAGWSGEGCSGTGTCTVTMSQARDVTATFVALYTLTVTKTGSGSGTVSGGGIDCGTTCGTDYDDGTVVTLTASASAGSFFAGWSGDCSGTASCTVTMTQARAVTATFLPAYPLSVTGAGSGSGSVTSSPSGIDCGATCSLELEDGTAVTLTAVAASGSRFAGWSGEGCSGTGTCTVTMSQARDVTVTFVALYTLTVTKSGSGSGAVSGSGIDCGTTCGADYDDGTSVTLSAAVSTGSRFAGWSGDCSGTQTCTVTMNAARAVAAAFVAVHTLTVTTQGPGAVTGGGSYDHGTVVTLTATPSPGARFLGWSGECSGTGTCTVTMTEARSVTATFAARHVLTVTKHGSGRVRSHTQGIDCGTTCASEYDEGTVVTLEAVPASSSRFVGWLGACSGARLTCTVAMSGSRNVTATFASESVRLSRRVSGRGAIVCEGGCRGAYEPGAEVTLRARPDRGQRFLGWSGACRGAQVTCTVSMDAARHVRARFGPVLALRLELSRRLVYHLPYERGRIRAVAAWGGRPLAGARVELVITCPGRRSTAMLPTDADGSLTFAWGTTMPDRVRLVGCRVEGRVRAHGQHATARPGTLRFIHPLWPEATWHDGRLVVRIWGRAGERVRLFANGHAVGEARSGHAGWVDVVTADVTPGSTLWVTGARGHVSHRITT